MSSVVTAQKVEERWTPTTVEATYVLHSLSRHPGSGDDILVNLPLLNLGWTFTLSLAAIEPTQVKRMKGRVKGKSTFTVDTHVRWKPTALAFRQHTSPILWGNTTMDARFLLTTGLPPAIDRLSTLGSSEESLASDSPETTLLHTMVISLADTNSKKVTLESNTITLSSPSKISFNLTISKCPFPYGLFQTHSNNDAEAQMWLTKQCGDRLLSRSLTTGIIYNVRFLARSTAGHNGHLLETYASLSVLQGHVNPSSAPPSEEWTSALTALDDKADAKPVTEISCPEGYEYELDSDFDEDEVATSFEPPASAPGKNNSAILEGRSEHRIEESSSSLPSIDGAGNLSSFNSLSLPEEITKDQVEPSPASLSVAAVSDWERTIVVRFAAHKTWHAFLWYCYTGQLEFNELKSKAKYGDRCFRAVGDGPPSCSPKSIYRLAYLVGDKDLKAKALKGIRKHLTETNVLDEIFSVFTSKYPEVRETQLDFLMEHCKSPEVKKTFISSILKFSEMRHAMPALEAFYDRLAASS